MSIVVGQWCSWIMKKNWGHCVGCTARWKQNLRVQRTTKRAELTTFLCLLRQVIETIKVHVDNKGIIDGLWRGERKCISPKAGDADLWIEIWEQLQCLAAEDIVVEVAHVKAHRTKKGEKEMSHFEKFVTEDNERADELARTGAMLDEGFLAEARADTMQQKREEVHTQLCSMQPASFVWWRNGKIVKSSGPSRKKSGVSLISKSERMEHRTEWCAEANKYRRMRSGRGSRYMKMPGKCTGPISCQKVWKKWEIW